MGRIKTTLIKRTVKKLIKDYKDKFTIEFEKNKQIVNELADIPSKKLRNIVAGYLTRQIRLLTQNPTSKSALKTQT